MSELQGSVGLPFRVDEGCIAEDRRPLAGMLREAVCQSSIEAVMIPMEKYFESGELARLAREAMGQCLTTGALSPVHSAAINLFTRDTPFYAKLNMMLWNALPENLSDCLPYLKLLATSLQSLPPKCGTVFRLVADTNGEYVSYYKSKHSTNETVTWYAPASCTTEMGDLKTPQGVVQGGRVVFIITNSIGANISEYSYIGYDKGVLLFACSRFAVKAVWEGSEGIHFIQLEMLWAQDEDAYDVWQGIDADSAMHMRLQVAEEEVRQRGMHIHALQARLRQYNIDPNIHPTPVPHYMPQQQQQPFCNCMMFTTDPNHQCSPMCVQSGCNGSCSPKPQPPQIARPVGCGCRQATDPNHACSSFCGMSDGCNGTCEITNPMPPQSQIMQAQPQYAQPSQAAVMAHPNTPPPPVQPSPQIQIQHVSPSPPQLPSQTKESPPPAQQLSCECRRLSSSEHQCVSLCATSSGCSGSCGFPGHKRNGKQAVKVKKVQLPVSAVAPKGVTCGCKRGSLPGHQCVVFCANIGCNTHCGLPGAPPQKRPKVVSKKLPSAAVSPTTELAQYLPAGRQSPEPSQADVAKMTQIQEELEHVQAWL